MCPSSKYNLLSFSIEKACSWSHVFRSPWASIDFSMSEIASLFLPDEQLKRKSKIDMAMDWFSLCMEWVI
jgi:hypothetical protein